jgi:hypothetical protein
LIKGRPPWDPGDPSGAAYEQRLELVDSAAWAVQKVRATVHLLRECGDCTTERR